MAMDLTGIENRNEYYTNHYFASIFEENAAETIKRWKDEASANDTKTPWAQLKEMSAAYYRLRDQLSRARGKAAQEKSIALLADALLKALGYGEMRKAQWLECGDGAFVPVAMELTKANHLPRMWIMLAHDPEDDEDILTGDVFLPDWNASMDDPDNKLVADNETMIGKVLFGQENPPRWVLLISMKQIALIDRNKWNEKRLLVFDLDEIFSRREESTLQAISVLLHKESLCPENGNSLLDVLDDNSHKHASGVSKDLKYALRQCIELLGNEVIYDMRERQHIGVFGKDLAGDLTLQCLRYMYRILFMLFIEAKPELGYAPMKADTYAMGYSFETLREIADTARGNGEINEDGNYIKESLDLLFRMVYDGFPKSDLAQAHSSSLTGVFAMDPLKAHIFDPEKTAMIENAHLRNKVLLQIIDLMSLTRPRKGQRRGRISYANLGVNQLGAVYEALLSYRGFFAEEDLYEVKRKGDTVDELDVGYFVPERELHQYDEDERVRNEDETLRVHPKGEFIYRLAGREREKSASYYTPEVLTKCLVKYALKELLEGKTADDILQLAICEPAMGSAAFLNEAVSQLAEAYLLRKEKELGKTVPSDQRVQELQKVKMLIADRNVYGIDLNPTAVELAEVSLWLNTIYQGGYVPWFRTQIVNGNSLIGARRQCYEMKQTQGKNLWYNAAPTRIEPGEKRSLRKGHIYHFLLGDPGMCSYTDKVIKAMEPEKLAHIKNWNKAFTKELRDDEQDDLLRLCTAIDSLWDAHTQMRHEIKEKCTDPLSVWGQPADTDHHPTTIRDKDRMYDDLYLSKGGSNASPYARLKAVMDYWCALWFWPIDKAEELPTRQEFLWDVNMLLGVDIVEVKGDRRNQGQLSIFDDMDLDPYAQELVARYGKFGAVNLDNLRRDFPRLRIANEVAQQQKFFHWELEFADIFAERGGFDLFVGNPPWVKITWEEKDVLSEKKPELAIRSISANDTKIKRDSILAVGENKQIYINEYTSITGHQNFLNACQNYNSLKGLQGNLYEGFLPQAWLFANSKGVFAFVHPESVFTESDGKLIRKELLPRLRKHFKFSNALKVFTDVHTSREFGLNVYSNQLTNSFEQIVNLYTPSTIEECYENQEAEPLYIKDEEGKRNIRGQKARVTRIGIKELKLFASIMDGSEDWRAARLMSVYATPLVDVLELFNEKDCRLGVLGDSLSVSMMWDETNAQKDNTIRRCVHFGDDYSTILSGAHIGTLNPLFNCSNANCKGNNDNASIALDMIPADYLPRTNYVPECPPADYAARITKTPWGTKYSDHYRIVARKMVDIEGERTLMPALIPPVIGHTNGIIGFAFYDNHITAMMLGLMGSLPFDYFIKACGKGNLQMNTAGMLPVFDTNSSRMQKIITRALILNCLTDKYEAIWSECFEASMCDDKWSKPDPRLNNEFFLNLSNAWTFQTPLRNAYMRRQAMLEIDVLAAMELGMSLQQLLTMYRIQFPSLQQHERDTYYDAAGAIVYAKNNALNGVGFDRKEWEQNVKGAPAGKKFYRTITDDTQPGGPVQRTIEYVAPFDKCDREKDYETAWEFFSKQK